METIQASEGDSLYKKAAVCPQYLMFVDQCNWKAEVLCNIHQQLQHAVLFHTTNNPKAMSNQGKNILPAN